MRFSAILPAILAAANFAKGQYFGYYADDSVDLHSRSYEVDFDLYTRDEELEDLYIQDHNALEDFLRARDTFNSYLKARGDKQSDLARNVSKKQTSLREGNTAGQAGDRESQVIGSQLADKYAKNLKKLDNDPKGVAGKGTPGKKA